jgi:flagellar biosynthesis protein FliR
MSTLPRTARAAITVIITVLLLPSAPPVHIGPEVLDIPLPMAMELVIGIAIGLTAAVIVQAASLAGEIISIQTGLSLGPALLPQLDLQGSALAQIPTTLAILVYVTVGGHITMLEGLAESLCRVPPGSTAAFAMGLPTVTALMEGLFLTAVKIAAPVMVTLLLVNLALAVLSRAVPQLNALMVSFPITIAVGLLMLGVTVHITAGSMAGWFGELPNKIDGVISAFQPVAVP